MFAGFGDISMYEQVRDGIVKAVKSVLLDFCLMNFTKRVFIDLYRAIVSLLLLHKSEVYFLLVMLFGRSSLIMSLCKD